MDTWEIYVLFFLVAFIYSTVGFGGGSGYLAILALFGVDHLLTRSTSLLCNITVVLGSVIILHRAGHLNFRKALPLVISSIPMAFLGGFLPIEKGTFYRLLGVTLVLAALATWVSPDIRKWSAQEASNLNSKQWIHIVIGAGIGFLSGMVGIGGGIFLAPVLYLMRWDEARVIAATSALFILLNSLFGLAGQMWSPAFQMDWNFALPLLLCAFLGGQIGVRIAAGWLPALFIQRGTAILVFYVGARLLLAHS